MIHKLRNFVLPFTLYLDVENAQNPVWIQFEKTNRRNLELILDED